MLTKSKSGDVREQTGFPALGDMREVAGLTATPAANTALYVSDEVQARRLRRQRRQERAATRGLGGWTVRMW